MAFPSPNVTVPSLTGDQIGYAGSGATTLVLGGTSTVFGLTKLEGLSKPDVRSGNTDRPRVRGAYVGLNLLKSRTITATLDIGGSNFGSYSNLAGALGALRTACSTEGTTEYPLWVQIPNFPLMACMARVVKKNLTWDTTADLGNLVKDASIQWEATDAYFYSAPTSSATINLPTPGVGFSFPLTFPWSFGGASQANQYTAVNNGDVPCYPVLTITGPCLNPSVSNPSITGNPTLTFDIQLNSGDQLVVDCDLGSVTYYPSGSTVGSPRQNAVRAGSTFFTIQPGSNTISFNSSDTSQAGGTLQVWWASAYSGLL